ncbi:MAG: YifB family Mg chelatase-like AAA ATPase [Eubacteriales bacterium]|nr:YifB family Mg chelatase-like AAA ATPase [Eubacteriales bacterium]
MLSGVFTASITGIDAELVTVETDICRGLPAMNTVGLPSTIIKEAKERIRSALIHSGFEFPMRRVVINLSPASERKEGSHFDLPMAVGILISCGIVSADDAVGTGFIGELSLAGTLVPVNGVLPLVIGLKEAGILRVVVPCENAAEAALVKDVVICPIKNIAELVACMNGEKKYTIYNDEPSIKKIAESEPDFSEVRGQETALRSVMLSGAAGHGLYMMGVPGAGKSMIAKRIPSVLPALTYEEVLEVTKIYSVAGYLSKEKGLVTKRPFRAPHHSITPAALLGGGRHPKPGEISLAHRGVLFLDELPEFKRNVIDLMRQPLETGQITVERSGIGVEFPCRFILVAAGNPCKCGYCGDEHVACRCTPGEVAMYKNRISGPFLDRIDLQIKIDRVHGEKLRKSPKTSSAQMAQRILAAREIQRHRYKNEDINLNSELEGRMTGKYCRMTAGAGKLLAEAYNQNFMSVRIHEKVIKIARTIADMEESDIIREMHIAEAMSFRAVDDFLNDK